MVKTDLNNNIMKTFYIILLLMLSGLFFACNHTDTKIIKYVQSACPSNTDTCTIDLQKILNVDYDSMFLFGEFTQPDEISSIMGITYSSNKTIPDSEKRIILLKDKQIVYENDFSTRFMKFEEITERIDTVQKNSFYLVHYSSLYLVSKDLYNESNYIYYLKAISNNTQYSRIDYNWQKGYKFEEVTK